MNGPSRISDPVALVFLAYNHCSINEIYVTDVSSTSINLLNLHMYISSIPDMFFQRNTALIVIRLKKKLLKLLGKFILSLFKWFYLFFFFFPAGKLFVAPLILVLGLALGAIAVVIGKKSLTYLRLESFECHGESMNINVIM